MVFGSSGGSILVGPPAGKDTKHGTDNTVSSGVAGSIVQAGQINGGVHHHATGAGVRLPYRSGAVPTRAGCYQRRAVNTILLESVRSGAPASVVSGMGGVGKTQLAVDIAEQLWTADELDLLIWATARSRDTILADYTRVATVLTGTADLDLESGARRLLDWLASARCRWLVVLDDLDSPAHLVDCWPPQTATGRVVVTTRRQDAALLGHGRQVIEVDLFTPTESSSYLMAKLGGAATGVEGVAQDLGHLPLALSQAAAYMLDRNLTCADYRCRLADQRRTLASLVPEDEGLPDQYRNTIAATWSLSIERADQLGPRGLARHLMGLLSLTDPNGLPVAVLSTPPLLTYLSRRVGRPVTIEHALDALASLRRLNLAMYDPASRHREVRVHGMLQRSTRDRLSISDMISSAAVLCWAEHFAWMEGVHDPLLWLVLRANSDALSAATRGRLGLAGADQATLRARALADFATRSVTYLSGLRAAAVTELGPAHPDTLMAARCLATWQGTTGDVVSAAATFSEICDERTRMPGHTDLDVLSDRRGLIECRGEVAGPAQALRELTDLLADCERALGVDHPETLAVRYGVARWQARTGDRGGAADAFDQLHDDCVRALGADHFETIGIRYGVARARWRAGEHAAAVLAYEQLYNDHLRVLGADHPDTRTARRSLRLWQDPDPTRLSAVTWVERQLVKGTRCYGHSHPAALDMRIFFAAYRMERDIQAPVSRGA